MRRKERRDIAASEFFLTMVVAFFLLSELGDRQVVGCLDRTRLLFHIWNGHANGNWRGICSYSGLHND